MGLCIAADTMAWSRFSTESGPSRVVSAEDEEVNETSRFSCAMVVWYKRDGAALFSRLLVTELPVGVSMGRAAVEVRPNADIMLWMSFVVPRSNELGSTRPPEEVLVC